jgi:hypothetical protein
MQRTKPVKNDLGLLAERDNLKPMPRHRLFVVLFVSLSIWACTRPADRTASSAAPVATQQAGVWLETLNYNDDDRDPERRLAAIQLGVHREPTAVDALARRLMGDRDPGVRAACAYALGRIGGAQAVQTLIAALADPAPEVTAEAVRALSGHVDDRVAERLTDLARRTDGERSLLIWRVLAEAGRLSPAQATLARQTGALPPPHGNSIYVDPFSGNDAADGAEARPVKTIAKGLSLLTPSGALYLAGGKAPIREALVVPDALSGQVGAPTRIAAWPGKPRPLLQPTISVNAASLTAEGEGVYRVKVDREIFGAIQVRSGQPKFFVLVEKRKELRANTCWMDRGHRELVIRTDGAPLTGELELAIADRALMIHGAHDVEVQGFDVRYAPDSGIGAEGAFRATFVDCSASYCDRHGIFIYYSPDAVVRGCRAEHCDYQGISVRSSPHALVSRCRSEDNGVDGILFLYDSDYATAIDCIVRRNQRGINFIEGSDFGRVIACEIRDNRSNGVAFESGSLAGEVVAAP